VATSKWKRGINLAQYAPILGLQEILGNRRNTARKDTNISVSRAMTVQADPEKAHRSVGIAYAIAGVLT